MWSFGWGWMVSQSSLSGARHPCMSPIASVRPVVFMGGG